MNLRSDQTCACSFIQTLWLTDMAPQICQMVRKAAPTPLQRILASVWEHACLLKSTEILLISGTKLIRKTIISIEIQLLLWWTQQREWMKCFHSQMLQPSVRLVKLTLLCSRGASYTLARGCENEALTLVGHTSLQSHQTGTYVQIPAACLQQSQVHDLQHKTVACATSRCRHTHTHTDTNGVKKTPPLPAFNSCTLIILKATGLQLESQVHVCEY